MVNEQILNKLKQLGINPETENLTETSLINSLLDTIAQNKQLFLNHQNQVEELTVRLEKKKKPRRLSASSNSSEEGQIYFPLLSPKIVSPITRPTPPRTPRSPRPTSPATPKLEAIAEMVIQQEVE